MKPYPQTTAHEREILQHYFMHADLGTEHVPWKNGSENWLPLDHQVIDKFVALGLLVRGTNVKDRHPVILARRDALAVYFEALDCVPLPVLVWKIPEFQA